jgi:thiosulfate/3-mercaptopyruvate sulfurtransferase
MSPVSVVTALIREAEASLAPVLVAPVWLRTHLDDVRIVDTRSSAQFRAAHIAGAHSFPLDALIVDDSRAAALERLAAAAGRALAYRGVSPTDHVVLLDDHEESAALGAVLCELAGVEHVSVLLGGFAAWRATGGATTAALPDSRFVEDAWLDAQPDASHVASFEQLADAVDHGSAHVLDVRSQLEHEGIVGPPCCPERGSIPNSLHLEWSNFLDLAGAPRLASTVRDMLAQVGIGSSDRVIITCHSGRRAAAAARILRASGMSNVLVSLGSWHEWSHRRPAASQVDHGQSAALAHADR